MKNLLLDPATSISRMKVEVKISKRHSAKLRMRRGVTNRGRAAEQ